MLGRVISIVFYTFVLVALLSYFGNLNFILELFSHFRLQYCYAAIVFAILFLLRKDFKHLTIALCLFTLNFSGIYPYYHPDKQRLAESTTTSEGKKELKVLQINVQGGQNTDVPRTIKLINRVAPDIVGLSEITPGWSTILDRDLKGYPYRVVEPHYGGIGLYSKYPLLDPRIKYTGRIKRPRILARIRNHNEDTLFVLAHTVIPIRHGNLRNIELGVIADDIKKHPGPAIIFGDLNTTPWSHYFQKLLKDTGMIDSQVGFGIVPTWSAKRRPSMIPIDHLLATPYFKILDRKTLNSVGSDHYPVLVKLAAR